jgi:hypothetical protein
MRRRRSGGREREGRKVLLGKDAEKKFKCNPYVLLEMSNVLAAMETVCGSSKSKNRITVQPNNSISDYLLKTI